MMDKQIRRYELNVDDVMFGLEEILSDRGYRTVQREPAGTWVFETHWGRGAAYGEIGSVLYGLLAEKLHEIDLP